MKQIRLTLAGRLDRLFASLLDRTLLAFCGGLFANALGTDNSLWMLPYFGINIVYYTAFTAGKWQATPGQRLLSIYVIHTNARGLDTRDALERCLAYLLPSLPLYSSMISHDIAPMISVWLIIFWFSPILYTPERAGVHDRICNTRVVTGRAEERGKK